MKNLLLVMLAVILNSCCVFSQAPPPQYLYVDNSCGAALPDYLPMFEYTDNCGIDTVWQSPTRGSWLTVPTTTVLIRVIDKFNNHTDLMFTVTLLDTIPPLITLRDSSLITENYTKINNMYNIADRMLAFQELWFDNNFDYNAVNIPDTLQPLQQYFNKILLTWTSPALAFTGKGSRVHTFISETDSIYIAKR